MDQNDIQNLKQQLEKAKEILIVTHERPTHDSIGSALALSLGLQGMGKKVTVACPDPMTVELSGYVGVNKIVTEVRKKNFVISLDYAEGSIEKVSYNIEGDKFNLVIEPRPGFENFSSDKVHFNTVGAGAELIITVDTIHLGGLRKLYDNDRAFFADKPVINIDHHANNASFGTVNLINPGSATSAEIVYRILEELGVTVTEDIATNIVNAIYNATNNFQSPYVKADTFETIAKCYRAGGKRFTGSVPPAASQAQLPVQPPPARPVPPQQPAPQPVAQPEQPKPIPSPKEAPPDWLKPKIFKSTSTV